MHNNIKDTLKSVMKNFGIVLVLIIVMIVFGFSSPSFATLSNFRTILTQVSVVCICSLGMMFVLITGGIDLSVGWMMSAVGMITSYFIVRLGVPIAVSCLAALIFALIIGTIQGAIITKVKIQPFIVTMAFMSVLRGFSFIITSGQSIYGIPSSLKILGQGRIGPVPVPVILMIIAVLIAGFVLRKTYFGRYFYAIGGNEYAARLSGINTDKVKIVTYMISSFFACIAGIIMLSRIATGAPNTGEGYEFDVITVCVLGGISMTGGSGKEYQVFVGAMIIAVLNNGLIILHVNTYVQLLLKGLILLMAVMYDSMQKNRSSKISLA